jgi:hypothetical protein
MAKIDRKFAISARIDVDTNDTVWEIKCVSQISTEHLLQLCLYAWICRTILKGDYRKKQFKLLNIKSGERLRLECSDAELCFIAHAILRNKIQKHESISEQDFLNSTLGNNYCDMQQHAQSEKNNMHPPPSHLQRSSSS